MNKGTIISLFILLWIGKGAAEEIPSQFETKNLVAWCIVPFDASKRNPAQRAAMLKQLGITKSAYDWRKQHVAEFEEEILEYQKNGIEMFAFWGGHDRAFALFKQYKIHPQIWKVCPSPKVDGQQQKIAAAAKYLEPLVKKCAEAGCKFGLYNHGGWGGEPANLVAICKKLQQMGYANVGIVYNWHHAHDSIDQWQVHLEQLTPHLICLNLNGMNAKPDPKILDLGKGKHEQKMLEILLNSKYRGPIGILDHQNDRDTEEVLKSNLAGLEKLLGKR